MHINTEEVRKDTDWLDTWRLDWSNLVEVKQINNEWVEV